ncbi:MAG: hypothetical protein EXQ95_09405 [Alphaproteobacteria bacterium]|nr:hypothetical protein [Alphaproteobacteria bacterium]
MAIFLVMATYNPSGYSYFHWVAGVDGQWIVKILVGIVLAILYATFILATLRSLGAAGIAMWVLLFGAIVWFLIDIGLIERLTAGSILTILLVVLANVVAVGVSWSYMRARLSGQADTNDVTLP